MGCSVFTSIRARTSDIVKRVRRGRIYGNVMGLNTICKYIPTECILYTGLQ